MTAPTFLGVVKNMRISWFSMEELMKCPFLELDMSTVNVFEL